MYTLMILLSETIPHTLMVLQVRSTSSIFGNASTRMMVITITKQVPARY